MPLIILILIVTYRIYRYFVPPKRSHILSIYFGIPGSGKTTFAAWITRYYTRQSKLIDLCNKHHNKFTDWVLKTRLFKRITAVYSNVPITGSYKLDVHKHCGRYMLRDSSLIIDEAGIEYNNRKYKDMSPDEIYFFKYFRHYGNTVDVFSQSHEDMDITLRRLADRFYIVKKSLIPGFVVRRKIRRKIGIDEKHQICDLYSMGLPIIHTKRIWCPPLWKLFNSYSRKDLPEYEWELW